MTDGIDPLGDSSRPNHVGEVDGLDFTDSDFGMLSLSPVRSWTEYQAYAKSLSSNGFRPWQIQCEWPLDRMGPDEKHNSIREFCQRLINEGHCPDYDLLDLSERSFHASRAAVGRVNGLLGKVWNATNQNNEITEQVLYRAFGVLEDVWWGGERQSIKWHQASMLRDLNQNSLVAFDECIPHRAGVEFQRTEFGVLKLKVKPAARLDQADFVAPVAVTVFEGGDCFTAMILICLRRFHIEFARLVSLVDFKGDSDLDGVASLWNRAASWLQKMLYWQDRYTSHENAEACLELYQARAVQQKIEILQAVVEHRKEKIEVLQAVVEHHKAVVSDSIETQLKHTLGTEKKRAARFRARCRDAVYDILQTDQGVVLQGSKLAILLGGLIEGSQNPDHEVLVSRWPGLLAGCIADAERKQNAAPTKPDKSRWGGVVSLLKGSSNQYSMDVVHTAFGLLVGGSDHNVESLKAELARARKTLKKWQDELAQEAKPLIEKMDGLLRKVVEPIIMDIQKGPY